MMVHEMDQAGNGCGLEGGLLGLILHVHNTCKIIVYTYACRVCGKKLHLHDGCCVSLAICYCRINVVKVTLAVSK